MKKKKELSLKKGRKGYGQRVKIKNVATIIKGEKMAYKCHV
jgi:hypothetical protein